MRKIKYLDKRDQGARKDQQDSVDIVHNGDDVLIALGDGMGGHSGGKRASEIFISTARNHFESYDYYHHQEFFNNIIYETEDEIALYANQSGEDPRTTATLALILDNAVHFANVGDSRVYIFDREGLIIRSRDHSVPEMLLQMGEIEEHEMATHPDQNKLTKSLGPDSHVEATHYSYQLNYNSDYIVLVCSDGFWEYVDEQEMMYFLFNFELSTALTSMIDIARERGGSGGDNISVGVATLIADKPKKEAIEEDNWEESETIDEEIETPKRSFLQRYFILILSLLVVLVGIIGTILFTDRGRALLLTDDNQTTQKQDSNQSKSLTQESNKTEENNGSKENNQTDVNRTKKGVNHADGKV
ncbi:serine/threonine-protein phosphatase [Sulfurovum sp. bin170]|uniref:PP2C family protein-serine/threonine phosphatase n=1 Tax=Sulfurovum sp. bin170 TaxID=2695268 RepID=UPI0013E0BA49|nr:protein phosphatase 2C domain-containing protein [Sulfurovum sp. bin170]NEW60697.1 serine/threonine-protein phosphatase [Sulfurovum sp. bin170]